MSCAMRADCRVVHLLESVTASKTRLEAVTLDRRTCASHVGARNQKESLRGAQAPGGELGVDDLLKLCFRLGAIHKYPIDEKPWGSGHSHLGSFLEVLLD